MKRTALGLVLVTFAATAAAGDLSEPRYHESNDYSAQVFYRVDFGGPAAGAQSLGLRLDSVRLDAAGAPSLLQVRFGATGLDRLAINGVDLRGARLSAGQSEGGFGALTGVEWAAIITTTLLFAGVASDLDEDDEVEVNGTGGS